MLIYDRREGLKKNFPKRRRQILQGNISSWLELLAEAKEITTERITSISIFVLQVRKC